MLNRRKFIQTGAVGAGSLVVLSQLNCGGKSVGGTVTLITGAIAELKLIFPSLPALDKIVKLATDFNTAWVAGKFDSARTFFESLDTTVQQVMNDLEINGTTRVKLLVATLGIAVRTIAALIAEQGQAVGSRAVRAAGATGDRVKQLANAADAARILGAVKK